MAVDNKEMNLWIDEIDNCILDNLKTSNVFLKNFIKSNYYYQGKKIRGIFCILASAYGKFDKKNAIIVASAIEIFHGASLIHDDIVDKSTKRRGIETISSQYGIDMAIFTGDYLFTKATMMLSKFKALNEHNILSRALLQMCEGEVAQYHEKFNFYTSKMKYFRIIAKKTALLFSMSCVSGSLIGKCNKATTKQLAKFGFNYGMAFQITDDLKDLVSQEVIEGKPVLNDLRSGTMTLAVIYAAEESLEVKRLLDNISHNTDIRNDNDIWLKIKEEILKTGAAEKTNIVLNKYKERAKNAISELPNKEYSKIFYKMLDYLDVKM